MKNKKLIAILLTCTLAFGSAIALTGCGTETKATNQEVSDDTMMEEEVIVAGNNDVEETVDMTEEDSVPSKDYGDFVIYDNFISTDYEIDFGALESLEEQYTTDSDLDIYYRGGQKAGYMKAGTTIDVTMASSEWFQVVNPKKSADFDADFFVRAEDLVGASSNVVEIVDKVFTVEELETAIIDAVNQAVVVNWVDTISSDMEHITLEFEKQNQDATYNLGYKILTEEGLGDYSTFAVEFVDEDETTCTFNVYYKDKIDWETYED